MTTFEREADLQLAGLPAIGERFGGDDGQVFEEVARGGHTIDALVTRPNEAGSKSAQNSVSVSRSPVTAARSMNGWLVRTADRWATY